MRYVNTFSLTSTVNDWLANTRHPRILHIFDHACNLINEHREVLSIVTPQIGNAPFNLVIEDNILFSDHLSLQSPVSFSITQLRLGDLMINTADAKLWNPRPDWKELHSKRKIVLHQIHEIASPSSPALASGASVDYLIKERRLRSGRLAMTGITNYQLPNSLISNLTSALANADISSAHTLTSKLAGLGQGLTPAGDDFLMGAIYASWIIHPHEIASQLALEISEATAPLTTSLSAAWLRSAGKGEAGILWHNLFNSLILPVSSLESPVSQILSTGETSGADALSGFIGTFISYAEVDAKPCPS